MTIAGGLAVYFIIWWLVLFAVLPFGVRNAGEAGVAIDKGHDAGAPVQPMILKKAFITTIVAAVVFALFYWITTSGVVSLEDIPFIKNMPA
jgi:predicted secreted protein